MANGRSWLYTWPKGDHADGTWSKGEYCDDAWPKGDHGDDTWLKGEYCDDELPTGDHGDDTWPKRRRRTRAAGGNWKVKGTGRAGLISSRVPQMLQSVTNSITVAGGEAGTEQRPTSWLRTSRLRLLSCRKRRVTSGPNWTPTPRLLGLRPSAA